MAFRLRSDNIRLGAKTAHNFRIIDTPPTARSKNAYYDVEVEKITEDEKHVELFLKITYHSKKEVKKELIISKATLSGKEATFIGWCYAVLTDREKSYKPKAREYLELAIKNDNLGSFFDEEDIKSALPYYLLSKNNLYDNDGTMLRKLYRASKCSDTFHDFYWELFRHEKDKLRKINIAKATIKKYPQEDNEYFIDFIISDLMKKGRLKEARKFFEEQFAVIPKEAWRKGYPSLKVKVVELLTEQKDFENAEKILGDVIFNRSTDGLLKGKFYFEKGDFVKAIKCFSETITYATDDTDDTQASYYYLLACYAKTKSIAEIQDIIENANLCHQELVVYPPVDFSYEDFAEKTLKGILKLKIDELLKARVKGLLAFVQISTLPNLNEETRIRVLTKEEKKMLNEAEASINEALGYYFDDKAFNATYSNILYYKKDYDTALRYKIRAIEENSRSLTFVSILVQMSDASDEFLDGYVEVVKDAVKNHDVSIDNYIEHMFNEDAGALYAKKKYKSIKELYEYVKPNIGDLSTIDESKYYGLYNISLFELGYSLAEAGDQKEAKHIYELCLKEHADGASVLNNLAIIYEKEGDLKKAQELIKRAKANAKDDEIVTRNYGRITSNGNKNGAASQPKQEVQTKTQEKKTETVVEGTVGYLLLNGGKIEIGPAKNIPFKLLHALCPFGTPKATNAIFKLSSSERSKLKDENLSLLEKQDVLRSRIKELQEILSKKKMKVSLRFNDGEETVFLQNNSRG